ncbi:hypothetical protein ISS30_00450 [bacterium]|nr:hypothetical protein [bacterium]
MSIIYKHKVSTAESRHHLTVFPICSCRGEAFFQHRSIYIASQNASPLFGSIIVLPGRLQASPLKPAGNKSDFV